jgi:hypothetical protein
MTFVSEAVRKRWASSIAIYGVVSIAIVIVAWESDGDDWELPGLIVGYILLIWLTHTYARYVSEGVQGSWWSALREEFPVAAAGLPALVVSTIGAVAHANEPTEYSISLATCAITLVLMQIVILRADNAPTRRVVATAIYDLAAGAIVILLHVLVD